MTLGSGERQLYPLGIVVLSCCLMTIRLRLVHSTEFLASIDVARKTEATYRVGLHALAECLAEDPPTSQQAGTPEDNPDGVPAPVPLERLKSDSLAAFRHWMRNDRKYSRRTEAAYLAAAIRFVEWLDNRSLLPDGLSSARMKLVLKDSRGRRRVGYKTQPIKESVPLIVEYYDGRPLPAPDTARGRRQRLSLLRNRAMVHVLFATGMRAQELASLRRNDCADGAEEKVRITGKGEKERVVMLNPEAQAAIKAYLRERDRHADDPAGRSNPLFIRHDRPGTAAVTTKTVWQVVQAAARALGLPASVSPHDFRRYIATSLLSEGMPLESVQAFLGHESVVTTRTVYARTWDEVLEDQVRTYRPTPSEAARRARRQQ